MLARRSHAELRETVLARSITGGRSERPNTRIARANVVRVARKWGSGGIAGRVRVAYSRPKKAGRVLEMVVLAVGLPEQGVRERVFPEGGKHLL
jgi:hypothetical protein